MKGQKNYLMSFYASLFCACFMIFSCSDNIDDLPIEAEKSTSMTYDEVKEMISVDDEGYLNFPSSSVLLQYLDYREMEVESENEFRSSGTSSFSGFRSIADIKKSMPELRSSNDSEEMSVEEYKLMLIEDLLIDPILMEIMDPTLRIGVGDKLYIVNEYGTFSGSKSNIQNLVTEIDKFEKQKAPLVPVNQSIMLSNNIEFVNSFGILAAPPTITNSPNIPPSTATTSTGNSEWIKEYSVESYKWEARNWVSGAWASVWGKDISKENNFSSSRRVQVNLFNVNYQFYASSGLKVKMQKRKKFLGIPYWVSSKSDKFAVGFEKCSGTHKINTSYSSVVPSSPNTYDQFTSKFNSAMGSWVKGVYRNFDIVQDWADDIYYFIPEIMVKKTAYPTQGQVNNFVNIPANEVFDFLKKQTGTYVLKPVRKQIMAKDPRTAYFASGDNKNAEVKAYLMGVKEYNGKDTKVIRFDRSGGFKFSNGKVSGFVPSEFKIEEIDFFGAAYYDGKWRGVRFYSK